MGILQDKVAIVTGGGRGIGRAICLAFAKEGADVVLNDIDIDSANEVAKEVQGLGRRAVALKADVSKREDAKATVNAALTNFGKIDILVNNAGITRDVALYKMSDEDWDVVFNICLKGTFLFTQEVADHMVKAARKEREEGKEVSCRKIINITSGSGIRGNPGQANYSSAKAGLIGLTKSNAKELGRFNVCVNAIAPFALTGMTAAMPEEWKRDRAQRICLGRIGDAEKDIAPAVAVLASDYCNYITGQVINVSGGLDM